MILKLCHVSESPGGSHPKVSDSVSLGWGLCISIKIPDTAAAANMGTTL